MSVFDMVGHLYGGLFYGDALLAARLPPTYRKMSPMPR